MSIAAETTVTCPFCQKRGPFLMHQSVTLSVDPSAKEKILSGELMRFVCGGCQKGTQVTHTLLVNDTKKNLMIYLVPGTDDVRNKYIDALGPDGGPGVAGCTTRLVADIPSLKDKMLAFEAGLDDRLLEVTKLVIKLQNPTLKDARLYFEGMQGEAIGLACVVEQGVQRISVAQSGTYTFMADKLGTAGVLSSDLGPWPLVGERWAAWAIGRVDERR
jgi:hypothetical protein